MGRSPAVFALVLAIAFVSCGGSNATTRPSVVPPATSTPVVSSGAYELTFAADASCAALPPHARSRTYTTDLLPGAAFATLGEARFPTAAAAYPLWNLLYTKIDEESADIWFQDPPIWESLSDESYLVIYGDAHGRIAPDTSTLRFWARFEYCAQMEPDGYPECEVPVVTCESPNHQLTVRRK